MVYGTATQYGLGSGIRLIVRNLWQDRVREMSQSLTSRGHYLTVQCSAVNRSHKIVLVRRRKHTRKATAGSRGCRYHRSQELNLTQ